MTGLIWNADMRDGAAGNQVVSDVGRNINVVKFQYYPPPPNTAHLLLSGFRLKSN